MSALSNFLETKLYDHVCRNTAYTSPTTIYVALFTAVTDAEAGTGTEVATGSYARTAVTMGASTNGAGSNSGAVTFPTATASWGTITHFGIYDASSGGNLLFSLTALSASKTVGSGDTLTFPIGDLDITFA